MAIKDTSGASHYQKPVLVAVGLILTIGAIIIVALRFWVRRRDGQRYGWDDWTILAATVLCTAAGIVEILAAEIGGMGAHQRLGPNDELIHYPALTIYEKCRYANEVITTVNLGLIKVSVILFYRRIFTIRTFKIASLVMSSIVISWTVAFTVVMITQCVPPHLFWDRFEIDYGSSCVEVQPMYEGLAFSDLILDGMVLSLPIPFVLMLHMPWTKKIAVLDVLLLGAVVLGSGIARVVSFMQVINFTSHNPEAFFKDTLWYTAGPLFWLFAENAIAIVGACLPTLAPLWRRKRDDQSSRLGSFLSKLSNPFSSNHSTSQNRHQNAESDVGSLKNLVGSGATTDVHAESIPLEDRPSLRDGIQVHTAISTEPISV